MINELGNEEVNGLRPQTKPLCQILNKLFVRRWMLKKRWWGGRYKS